MCACQGHINPAAACTCNCGSCRGRGSFSTQPQSDPWAHVIPERSCHSGDRHWPHEWELTGRPRLCPGGPFECSRCGARIVRGGQWGDWVALDNEAHVNCPSDIGGWANHEPVPALGPDDLNDTIASIKEDL